MPTIDRTTSQQMRVDDAVSRKTEKPPQPRSFGALMGSAANVALAGVEIGATVVGGPLVGAAVRGVRAGVGAAAGGTSSGSGGVIGGVIGGTPSRGGPLGDGAGSTGEIVAGGAGDENGTLNEVREMQEQAQSFNLQYLALQEEVQQENRKFTTVSNVLKAKHETAKGAIGNIRS